MICTSCSDDVNNVNESNGLPIVQGYLYEGMGVDSIAVTLANDYNNADTILVGLNGLELEISDLEGNTTILENISNGLYRDLNYMIRSDQIYQLTFEYAGKIISSETYIPSRDSITISQEEISLDRIDFNNCPPNFTAIEPIYVEWNNPDDDYFYMVIQNKEADPEWVNAIFEQEDFMRPARFTNEPQITSIFEINPRREIQQFGIHEIIIYKVNPEYAALYQSSGTNSNTITSPPTNIENGLGIFTGVSSDTIYLQVLKN